MLPFIEPLSAETEMRSRQEWLDACKAFHARLSAMDVYIERLCQERRYADRELLEFAICFLELDPWFFGSGHLKQELLTRLNRSDLHEPGKRRLRSVLVDAVNRRGTREFKYYCRLAIHLTTAELVKQLQLASAGSDRARASRSRMMLERIARHAKVAHESSASC